MKREIRNGVEVATRMDVVNELHAVMSQIEVIPSIMKAIMAMDGNRDLAAQAKHVTTIVQIAHNDLDVLREAAESAGIIGELAEIRS
ncbi:MAG: hypothetical protein HPY82_08430 [Gammaproteobacteria bacterium]|nr:hypothetical protein [Gammaproteobacteria bacterium]